jgi:hypothetical protein
MGGRQAGDAISSGVKHIIAQISTLNLPAFIPKNQEDDHHSVVLKVALG